MKKVFAGLLVISMAALFGCGGGGGSGTTTDTTVKKEAAVTGTVSFPSLSVLISKQVAATVPSGTIIPPVLIITDLNGAAIATPTLIVDPSNTKNFTYTVSLDASKNYVFKASWGGQVLRALADLSTLSTLSYVINITPVSTAAVLVAEKNLNFTYGKLGTSTASTTITDAQVSVLNPVALLTTIGTPTYATLVTAVTTALTGLTDPAGVVAVTTAVSSAPAYVPPVTTPVTLTSLTVTPAAPSIVVGATQQFTATGTYSDASTKNLTALVTWSSSKTTAATIATGGIATTVAAGTTTITAASGAILGTALLTATAPVSTSPTGFTAAMLLTSANFVVAHSNGTSELTTYSTNGTATGYYPETWSINNAGQLIITYKGSVNAYAKMGTVATYTLISNDNQTYTASESVSDGSTGTATFTYTSGIKTDLSGIWFGTLTGTGLTTIHFVTALVGNDTLGYSGPIVGDDNCRLVFTPVAGVWHVSLESTLSSFLYTTSSAYSLNSPTQAAIAASVVSVPRAPSALSGISLAVDITATSKRYYSLTLIRY